MENLDSNLIQVGNSNLNLPHDVVTLPTGGVFYKNKQKTVKIGYLTASDESTIVDAIQKKGDKLITNLIRSKLYEPELKINELLRPDIEAILIFLRNSSFGPEYNIISTDPKTDKTFETKILLDELNIKRPNVNPNSDGTFEVKLPKSEAIVKIRPLSYVETEELDEMADTYPQGRVAPTVSWRLNKEILELNGSPDRGKIASFVEQMPIMDSKYIRKFMDDNEPRLDMKKKIKAPSGETLTVNVGFGVEFFRPFF